MGHVPLLAVLKYLPYAIMLSFLSNGPVANVKYLIVFVKVQVYLYSLQFLLFHSTINRFLCI